MDFFLTNNMYKMHQKVFKFDCHNLDGFDFQAQRDELKRIIKGSIIEEEQEFEEEKKAFKLIY